MADFLLQLTNRNMVELELGLLGCTPSNDYVEELSIESKFHLSFYTIFMTFKATLIIEFITTTTA